jgi:glycosyltransferase involved in cell wall biosynthesis
MKILHLLNTNAIGGMERMVLDLARELDKDGYRSLIRIWDHGPLHDLAVRQGTAAVWIPPGNGAVDLRYLARLIQVVRRERIHLIHAHTWAAHLYGSAAAAVAGIPSVITIHDRYTVAGKRDRRLAYRLLGRSPTLIVAVSEDIRTVLTGRLGLDRERIVLVPNGIDTTVFKNSYDTTALRRELLGDRSELPTLVSVGNLRHVKGHDILLSAMREVTAHDPEINLLVVGDGPLRHELEHMADDWGLSCVSFTGYREDVPHILRASDIFVLASRTEGLSLSILEAMAAAKPVIATAVGGNREVVIPGMTGYLVPPEDPATLAARILSTLAHPDEARLFGRQGLRIVEGAFSLKAMVRKYEELYRNMRPSLAMGVN